MAVLKAYFVQHKMRYEHIRDSAPWWLHEGRFRKFRECVYRKLRNHQLYLLAHYFYKEAPNEATRVKLKTDFVQWIEHDRNVVAIKQMEAADANGEEEISDDPTT